MFVARRMCELAIELLLLLGRQRRANLIVRLHDYLLMLTTEILVQRIHFLMRTTHQCFHLMQLLRAEPEIMVEPVDEAARTRHSQ